MPPKRKAKAAPATDDEPPAKQARTRKGKAAATAAKEPEPADEDGDKTVVLSSEDGDPLKKSTQSKAKKGKAVKAASKPSDGNLNDTNAADKDATIRKQADSDIPFPELTQPTKGKATNVTKYKDRLQIPIDDTCPLRGYRVYIDPDDSVIYDATLNQTDASKNANNFYRILLLHHGDSRHQTWTRWGRVGEPGKGLTLGDGSLGDATKHFEKKFKEKTGLSWSDRNAEPKSKKYVYLEKTYEPDSDQDEAPQAKAGASRRDKSPPKCTLAHPVRSLVELIFNQQHFDAVMASMDYDANRLPLGKLSKVTITKAYTTLKELAALLDDPALAVNYEESQPAAVEHLSNRYYSYIPHVVSRSSRPPVISTKDMLKREVELLDSLSDLKTANDIIKAEDIEVEEVHPLDARFHGLGMREMTTLDHKSSEFKEIEQYLMNTQGQTHNYLDYKVEDIFRIERKDEDDRFKKSPYANIASDRRLLWHGSRTTNYGGILSQGLRIAPAEAPVSGYMFDKGTYLADMSSKSANYCYSNLSGGSALLLLCEAELGSPMQVLQDADYYAASKAKEKGCYSTWGQGLTGPKAWKDAKAIHPSLKGVKMPDTSELPGDTNVEDAFLQYNEYICYDVAQVKLRYLLRVRMSDDGY